MTRAIIYPYKVTDDQIIFIRENVPIEIQFEKIGKYPGIGNLYFKMEVFPTIFFEAEFQNSDGFDLHEIAEIYNIKTYSFYIKNENLLLKGSLISFTDYDLLNEKNGKYYIKLKLANPDNSNTPIEIIKAEKINRVQFLIFNLEPNNQFLSYEKCKLELRFKNYRISLQLKQHPDLAFSTPSFKTGDYYLTFYGEITQVKSSNIPIKKAKMLLNILKLFLSFSNGFKSSPILPIGYNSLDELVWENWDIRSC